MNIACDEIATATSRQGLINQGAHPPLLLLLLPPYKGSRTILQINGTWMTAHHKGELYKARQTKPMGEYLKRKYNWSDHTLYGIHWQSIKTTRQKLSHTKRMQTCKIMHGWLPVAHMRHHITGINQCPGCKCTGKTIDHLLQCPHSLLIEERRVILAKMTTTGIKQKIPKDILNTITQTLATHTGVGSGLVHKYNPEITNAITHQQEIGVNMMARGFLSKQWVHTIHPSRNPPQVMVKLQRLIWLENFDSLWTNRNNLLHNTFNLYTQEDDSKLAERITWYCKN